MNRHARRRDRRAAREDARWLATEREPGDTRWASAEPGNPLGVGYPLGSPLRRDEESHREAWMRVVRGDPCSYCSRVPFPCRFHNGGAATLDHIDAQSGPRRDDGLHAWTNYSGSCGRCNGAKSNKPLLLWLAGRGILR